MSEPRVTIPLWLRMAAAFGGVTGLFLLAWGGLDLRREQAVQEASHQARMEGLARTVAASLEGEVLASFQRSADMEGEIYRKMTERLRAAREANGLTWVGTSARDGRGRFYAVLDGGSPPPLPVGYPIFDGLHLRQQVYAGQVAYTPELVDEWGVWTVAMAPVRGSGGQVVGVVEVMEDAAWRSLQARRLLVRTLAQTLAVVLLSSGVATLLARQMSRPLRDLTEAARAVTEGHLDRDVAVRSRDEIGALAAAFNRMVAGLREREQIRATFGRFVSEEVAAHALEHGGTELVGEARAVTILFSDLRGFSALARDRGPAATLSLLNRYLAAMTEVILAHQGNLSEILGDGLLVLFGAPVARPDDPARAVGCALEMHRALARFNRAAGLRLEMGIGIATGEVVAGNIGSERRMKYGVVGAPINLAARLEAFSIGTQILISAETYAAVADIVVVGEPREVRAKGWAEPLVCYPVLAAQGIDLPEETAEVAWRGVDLPARGRLIAGKEVQPAVHLLRVQALGRRALLLRVPEDLPLPPRAQLVLDIGEGDELLSEVYGTITDRYGEVATLRITQMPAGSRARLDALTAPAVTPEDA